jgi:hypothetical protein
MRTKSIEIAGKQIIIRESKIKEIKENLIPRIGTAWTEISKGDISGIVDRFGDQLSEVFPELKGVEIEDLYPSELEVFVEAWVDVNFTGVRKLLGPLLSLAKLGQDKLVSDSGGPLGSLTTGKN